MASNRLEDKSVDEICEWLEDRGFPESVLRNFTGKAQALLPFCLFACLGCHLIRLYYFFWYYRARNRWQSYRFWSGIVTWARLAEGRGSGPWPEAEGA